jgi:hypothetical protein
VLAISKLPPGVAREDLMKIFPDEIRATVRLYLQGKITQWYSRSDRTGVIFILHCKDAVEARALLDELPFGKAKLLDFDLIKSRWLRWVLLGDAPAAGKNTRRRSRMAATIESPKSCRLPLPALRAGPPRDHPTP